ncbi:hypothetical protein [Krasilnikovia sp. MM14-A1259]|uniref:hypothetical protein n=1 Tax=Krasilnikovia sp. MM14-A1259 TaxID=3373539 RepID=UPI0037F208A4
MNVNPFSLPGRQDPRDPLDPLSGDPVEVLKQYVAVDNTQGAFRQFTRAVPDPSELMRGGQLVVAMGMDGCGKSSLINRCAWQAQTDIEAAGLQSVAVDARWQAGVTDSMDARINQVAGYLRDALRRRGMVTIDDSDLQQLREKPATLYSRLSLHLADNVVVVVRLPWTERIEEVVEYAQYAHPGLLLFCELRGKHGLDTVQSRLDRTDRGLPIVLEVGPLTRGHGRAFVEHRFQLSGHTNERPLLEPDVVERMISARRQSIREFQKFLYVMYESLQQSSNVPAAITWDYVLEFHYQMAKEL